MKTAMAHDTYFAQLSSVRWAAATGSLILLLVVPDLAQVIVNLHKSTRGNTEGAHVAAVLYKDKAKLAFRYVPPNRLSPTRTQATGSR